MRRHITLSFREVVGVEDEVLDVHSDQVGQASSDGTLTGEGALLASLNAKRTGKMTDIVATIQAEQDRIIRADLNQAVVVQGGPGTGKPPWRCTVRHICSTRIGECSNAPVCSWSDRAQPSCITSIRCSPPSARPEWSAEPSPI